MKQLTAFATLAALCAAAHAGVVFEVETKDREAGVHNVSIEVEEPNLSMPVPGKKGTGSGDRMIFRGDRGDNGQVIVVHDEERTYYVLDDETMAAMAGQVRDAMQQVEEMLKNLPPEQQEAIRRAREQGVSMPGMPGAPTAPEAPSETTVERTGQTATREGYPCVKYEVRRGGRMIRELWVTDWSNVEGGREVADTFGRLGAFFQAMFEALPPMPGGGPFGDGGNPFEEMGFENGFPVETTGFDASGAEVDHAILRGTARRQIDPAAFEPPAGYKRMSMGPQ